MDYVAIIFFTGLIVAVITWRYMDNKLDQETSKLSNELDEARRINAAAYTERQEEKASMFREALKNAVAFSYNTDGIVPGVSIEKAVDILYINRYSLGILNISDIDIANIRERIKRAFSAEKDREAIFDYLDQHNISWNADYSYELVFGDYLPLTNRKEATIKSVVEKASASYPLPFSISKKGKDF